MSQDADAAEQTVNDLISRARHAQRQYEQYDQAGVDQCVLAAGWAVMEPERNKTLATLAVEDTGLGNVADKVRKNHRKTLGLLRDLEGARSVGVIADDPETGITEIARPAGVVAAITPSTNPGATPVNKIINALKGRNAVIVAPSPKGWTTAARLIEFVHAELIRTGMPEDVARGLVQLLPNPVTKAATHALMREADLVVATGSQANIRAAYSSGTPAFGVGAGNVAAIVDETADLAMAAARISESKTFDNATSCSSENSLVIVDAVFEPMLNALQEHGAVLLDQQQKRTLQSFMWPEGKLSPETIAQDAPTIVARAGLEIDINDRGYLLVEESGFGAEHPFSGEKLCPVLTVYRAKNFADAQEIVTNIYAYQGAGHSVSLHSTDDQRAHELGLNLPVSRVIVNQVHCVGTGGGFNNGLPFSLSMGCGTWGGNNFSSNMNWEQYVNITRIARPIQPREPEVDAIFSDYFSKVGR